MKLGRHIIIAIILAISLLFVVFAFPGQGQMTTSFPGDDDTGDDYGTDTGGTMDCRENWVCSDWSPCMNGVSKRQCEDMNRCGTDFDKPDTTRQCDSSLITPCEEDWYCADWSSCIHGYMIRECIDRNRCGTFDEMPEKMMVCEEQTTTECRQERVCSQWSDCLDGLQKRQCNDVSNCTTAGNTTEETRICKPVCVIDWACGQWSACTDGQQARTCRASSNCEPVNPYTEVRECLQPATNQSTVQPSNASGNQSVPAMNQTSASAPTENESTRIYDDIRPNEPARMVVDDSNISVRQITLETREQARNVRLVVRSLGQDPADVPMDAGPSASSREVYNYVDISKENLTNDDIENASIEFTVTKSWVRERLINVSTIRLRRHSGDAWEDLPTTLIYEDNENFGFVAETPGFSIFAIAGEYMLQQSGGGIMCIPLDVRCYGNELQECDIDGLSWTIIEDCEFGCSSPGVCNNEPSSSSPVQSQDYVMVLMVIMLVVIVVLGGLAAFFKGKRKRASQDIRGISPSSGNRFR